MARRATLTNHDLRPGTASWHDSDLADCAATISLERFAARISVEYNGTSWLRDYCFALTSSALTSMRPLRMR